MTELAHSKLKYGLFSRVISCRDSLAQNCQNSCSKCSYPVHGHKRIDNDTFLASLSPGKRPDGKGGKGEGEGMRKGEGNVK